MRINILLCDTFPGLLPPEIPSYASMFRNLFRSVSRSVSFQVYPVMSEVWPAEIHKDEIYLITGCNRSVYENEKWIVDLLEWIRQAASEGVKIVGICFGHQAIAQTLGGRVERYAGGWGVGIRESVVVDEGLKKVFSNGCMRLLYNHHDQVLALPEGASILATSDFCRYEAFRIGNSVLAFQGHPEYTSDYEIHLLRNHAEDEDDSVKKKAVRSIQYHRHEGKKVAQYILSVLAEK